MWKTRKALRDPTYDGLSLIRTPADYIIHVFRPYGVIREIGDERFISIQTYVSFCSSFSSFGFFRREYFSLIDRFIRLFSERFESFFLWLQTTNFLG